MLPPLRRRAYAFSVRWLLAALATAAGFDSSAPAGDVLPSPAGRFLLVSSDGLYVVEPDGSSSWSHRPAAVPADATTAYDEMIYDGWPIANKRFLFATHRYARMIDSGGRALWEYRAKSGGEVKSVVPLTEGRVALTDSSEQAILEIECASGRVFRRIPIAAAGNAHTRYNLLRRTPSGHYLVALREEKRVVEVDDAGTIILDLPGAATVAERLADGSTLVSGFGLRRFDPAGREIWSFLAEDAAPHFTPLIGAGFAVLPDGRVLATNSDWHYQTAGANAVQLYVVAQDKSVSWVFPVSGFQGWKEGVLEPKTGFIEHRCMMVRLMP